MSRTPTKKQIQKLDAMIDDKVKPNIASYVLKTMIEKPENLTGYLKMNPIPLRLVSSFGQANNIKFGLVLENYFSEKFSEHGWNTEFDKQYEITPEDKAKYSNRSNKVDIDIVMSYKNTLVFIEQKAQDNHDSTKKVGQNSNFQEKAVVINRKYGEAFKKIYGIEWFIDTDHVKNGKEWKDANNEFVKTHPEWKNKLEIFYGEDIEGFLKKITKEDHSGIVAEFDGLMREWHKQHASSTKSYFNLNFDEDTNLQQALDTMEEYSLTQTKTQVRANPILKMMRNKELREQIFPIISPKKILFKNYLQRLKELPTKAKIRSNVQSDYDSLIAELSEYIKK